MKKLVWRNKRTEPNICLIEIKDKNIEEININGINSFLKNGNFFLIEEIKKMIFLKKIDLNLDEIKKEIFNKVFRRFKKKKEGFLMLFLRYMTNIYILNSKKDFLEEGISNIKNKTDIKDDYVFYKLLISSHILSFKDLEENVDEFFNFVLEQEQQEQQEQGEQNE